MSLYYTEKFKRAVEYVLKNEGGYVFDKNDLGGETRYGISQRSHPNVNIKELMREDAIKIYYCDYWLKGKFEEIQNDDVATKFFDLSVNMGLRAATFIVQRALRAACAAVVEDGIVGPQTLAAINIADPKVLLAAIKSEAASYYRALVIKDQSQKKFLNGWLNRAYSNVTLS